MKADLVVKNGSIVTPEATVKGGVAIAAGKIVAIGADDTLPDGKRTIDATGLHILPGLIDAHVHFRDPGVTHKEDFSTGSTAAVCGGITTIIDMPNQLPPTENAEQVGVKKKIGEIQVAVRLCRARCRASDQRRRHHPDGPGRSHRLQDFLRGDDRQPAVS